MLFLYLLFSYPIKTYFLYFFYMVKDKCFFLKIPCIKESFFLLLHLYLKLRRTNDKNHLDAAIK